MTSDIKRLAFEHQLREVRVAIEALESLDSSPSPDELFNGRFAFLLKNAMKAAPGAQRWLDAFNLFQTKQEPPA
jgi:hypothetical protein